MGQACNSKFKVKRPNNPSIDTTGILFFDFNAYVETGDSQKWHFLVASTIGPLTVYCEIDEGQGWTVLLQRKVMDVGFGQYTWEQYKQGFGNITGESILRETHVLHLHFSPFSVI